LTSSQACLNKLQWLFLKNVNERQSAFVEHNSSQSATLSRFPEGPSRYPSPGLHDVPTGNLMNSIFFFEIASGVFLRTSQACENKLQ